MQLQMSKFSNFQAAIDDVAELQFLNGGHRLPDEAGDVMPERLRQLFLPPYFEWWNARETGDGVVYDHIDTSLSILQRHIMDQGPYDGVLGFSQGGSVAHLLSLLSLRDPAFTIPPPAFGVFISARTTRHAAHADLLTGAVRDPLPLPSLVIHGGNDANVPSAMTRELMTTLDPSLTTEIFLPEGTHRIPKLSVDQKATVRAFLQKQQRAAVARTARSTP